MDDETARALNDLNLAFYRQHAAEFSAKRERPWRGWSRLLDWIPRRDLSLLDVGCGNARFGRFLAAHRSLTAYTGVDASEPLLEIARRDPPSAGRLDWVGADFVASEPDAVLPDGRYDLVVLFGVLHGVPGEARRRALLDALSRRLEPGGLLVFTCWHFASDPRIAGRLAARDALPHSFDVGRLDAEDHLLPWGDAGDALRYCADVGAAERARLLAGLPLEVLAEFSEDGPNGDLNHYTLLRRAPPGRPDRG